MMKNYLSELSLKIKDLQNVFIKDPIFGSEKIKQNEHSLDECFIE